MKFKFTFLFTFLLIGMSLLSQPTAKLLIDISPNGSSSPENFFAIGNTFYFSATDGQNGVELWKTDGTAAGTAAVEDINQGSGDSNPFPYGQIGSELLFIADDGVNGRELWKTDGTANGTVLIKDINAGSESAFVFDQGYLVINGVLYFGANSDSGNNQLWRSDGTEAGTFLLKEICPSCSSNTTGLGDFVELNGKLYLGGIYGLWESDGTEAGTVLIFDGNVNSNFPESTFNMRSVNDKIFFRGATIDNFIDFELWISDGTAAGTVLVELNDSDFEDGDPRSFFDYKGMTYFIGNGMLWRSDGTPSGTALFNELVLDFAGNPSDNFDTFYIWEDKLYFSAQDEPNTSSLTFGRSITENPNETETLAISHLNDIEFMGSDDFLFFKTGTFFLDRKVGFISSSSNFVTVVDIENPATPNDEFGYAPTDLNIMGNRLVFVGGTSDVGKELRYIDIDGLTNSMEVLALNDFSCFPNPTNENTTISFSTEEALSEVRIIDMQGRVLERFSLKNQNSRVRQFDLQMKDWANGTYFVLIVGKNGVFSEKIVKQ